MLQITPQMKILVALAPVDFRKGIDGLVQLCKATLEHDPFSGAVFAFRNRRATAVKVLVYDGQGFWLCQKRLSRGCSGPPSLGGSATRSSGFVVDRRRPGLAVRNRAPPQVAARGVRRARIRRCRRAAYAA